ncbi:MAG: chemotaxis protein CheA [Balneola sp.]|nr:chemotaxis protein CheA [Balneola sp.]|tara:strand:+ start:31519 stop:34041 length:2523 start_codon:yes stop_codon:yes gene_type:complete
MSNDLKKETIQELETIIRLLADVWPTDRENLAEAGARFEKVIGGMDQNFGQLQKLINLSWEGLKHLYEKDDFFMTVKASTMQAVNTVREYIIEDGDINVEDFEKSFNDLEKSLSGGSESADKVIELDEEPSAEKAEPTASEGSSDGEKPVSLDDLAALIMTMDEETASRKDKARLGAMIEILAEHEPAEIGKQLEKGLEIMVKAIQEEDYKGWLREISGLTEEAINKEEGEDWDESEPQSSEVIKAEPEQEEKKSAANSDSDIFIVPDDIEMEMVGEFVTECSDLIQMAESALLELEESPGDDELINTIFRSFHTIKGTSAFMGLDPISEFTHSVETFLSMVREGDLNFDQACADISLDSIDIITKMLAEVETIRPGDKLEIPPRFTPMMRVLEEISEKGKAPADALGAEEESLREAGKEAAIAQQAPANGVAQAAANGIAEAADSGNASEPNSGKNESEASVRVSVNRLDRLIDMVGELVIAHSVVAQDEAIPQDSDLNKKVNHATKILRELQDTSLTLRMVPLKATFHKMNRLVRDLSRKAGKKVKFTTVGEDTEIDRNMVDIINEPLIHMIRNALDHGIETTEERTKSGKDETAYIELTAAQEGGKVVIKIRDDGRGINKDIIMRKAVEKGLVDPDKKLSDKEIYNLIFLPGFSSAEKVTDLSGRGVGMDVVRRSIEQLQGKVDVESELGSGTTITIELPFTLAITDGMVVRVGEDRFIVPTINIDMTFRAESNEVFTVMGESEQVSFRGRSVPVIRLHRLFEISGAVEDLSMGTLLVIKNNSKRYALLVDEVIGQQQLVGKSINMLVKMDHISGGAIMGDGRVGLILDTAALIEKE